MNLYDLHRLQVLLAEDNELTRTLVRTLLRALGIRNVAEAGNGDQALRRLRGQAFDVLITDWRMQPTDGLTLTQELRRGRGGATPHLPVILMTELPEYHEVVKARDAGVTEILVKPMSASTLYAHLLSIIEQPRPFVRSHGFLGPCRRRRKAGGYNGPERRRRTPVPVRPARPDELIQAG